MLNDCHAAESQAASRSAAVHERVFLNAARCPDAVAVISGAEQMTFGQLAGRARGFASQLRALGVGPDVVAGLCLQRTPEMIVGLLAILEAGGAYLPLDPGLPAQRLAFICRDAGASVVVTDTRGKHELDRIVECRVVSVSEECGPAAVEESACPEPENLAYVIYTSGSTGKPKGVMVHHAGLANYVTWANREYDAGSEGGAPVATPLSFDATVTSLWVPLAAGRPIDLMPEGALWELPALIRAFKRRAGYALAKLTPRHLDAIRALNPRAAELPAARTFVIGGEALYGKQVQAWRERAHGTRLYNEYGPTECVVGCVVHRIDAETPQTGPIPIGRPISNMQTYVLDDRLDACREGTHGQLHIAGVGVARGYRGRPGLTAERFIPDGFGAPGSRMYRTGDWVRLRGSLLEYLGRRDQQVKIRGFRVELGEVEATLLDHPSVSQAATACRVDRNGETRLVVYYVAKPAETPPSPADIRAFLLERLPDYMVPSFIVPLEDIPLSVNGKVDRTLLPSPPGMLERAREQEGRVA